MFSMFYAPPPCQCVEIMGDAATIRARVIGHSLARLYCYFYNRFWDTDNYFFPHDINIYLYTVFVNTKFNYSYAAQFLSPASGFRLPHAVPAVPC